MKPTGLLRDKVLVLTGIGPGMGRRLALAAASEGARVVLGARTRERIDGLVKEIRDAGGAAIAVATDVRDAAHCERIARAAVEAYGRIDGLTNAAYVFADPCLADSANLEKWQETMDVVCFGALRMSQAVLPIMTAQKAGSIVNISSMVTRRPPPQHGDYTIAKSALNGVTRQLAQEVGASGVRVNTVSIGWMWGPEVQRRLGEMATALGRTEQSLVDDAVSRIPIGRMPTEEDCVGPVLFLLSDYARGVHGAHIDVNGGETFGAF
jgi:NAD(P)-dependent dehydrogenase (short-subunit alcohol dehydrogenase family)